MEESVTEVVPVTEPVSEPVPTTEFDPMGQLEYTPPPPVIIRLYDILNEVPILAQREAQDKATLEGIANQSFDSLKSKLIEWALQGFRNAFPLFFPNIANTSSTTSHGGLLRALKYATWLVHGCFDAFLHIPAFTGLRWM